MSSRIPDVLRPFIHLPPEHSLYVISHVLGATSNWLIVRYLCAAFSNHSTQRRSRTAPGNSDADLQLPATSADAESDQSPIAVVMVSWMREYEFWKTEARRAGGLNLDQIKQRGLFAHVDVLSNLFVPNGASSPTSATQAKPSTTASAPRRPRTPPPTAGAPAPATKPTVAAPAGTSNGETCLNSPTLIHIETTILNTISQLKHVQPTARVLLILDTPTLLLETLPSVTSTVLDRLLLTLRGAVYSTILACPADAPLTQSAAAAVDSVYNSTAEMAPKMPLETENAAFMIGAVHQASKVLSCRRLGTGWAEDVSGVIRVTNGGSAADGLEGDGKGTEEGEWLYYVGGDGGVKVWGRGEGG